MSMRGQRWVTFLAVPSFPLAWAIYMKPRNGQGITGKLACGEYTTHQFVVLKAWLPGEFMLISLSLIHVLLKQFKQCSVWLMYSSYASQSGALIDDVCFLDASHRDGEDTCVWMRDGVLWPTQLWQLWLLYRRLVLLHFLLTVDRDWWRGHTFRKIP